MPSAKPQVVLPIAPHHGVVLQCATASSLSFLDNDIAGIVLAGSHQWGEGEFDRELRGPLIPVANCPLIAYPLEWLRVGGVHRATICAYTATAKVRGVFGSGASVGLDLDYFEDLNARGPAGCAHDAIRRSSARTFVVVEGSVFPSLDLRLLLEQHRMSGAAATVVAEIDRRKPTFGDHPPRLPGGIYVFERAVLESVAARGYQDIKEGLLERLYASGQRVALHAVHGVSPRVLNFATYASVNGWLISQAHTHPMRLRRDYQPVAEGLHHATAHVDVSARLIGPVLLGPGVRVEADVVIVGPSSVGTDSIVKRGAVVSRSIIWDHCVVGVQANVDASLLADGSQVADRQRLVSALRPSSRDLAPVGDASGATRVARPGRSGLLAGLEATGS